MRFFFSMMFLLFTSYTGKSQQVDVNILDSNSVKSFIKNSTICEQIQAAHKFISNIVQGKGCGIKLLESLSKNADYRFYLPISTGNFLLTNSQKIEFLKEQLDELLKQKQCGSK